MKYRLATALALASLLACSALNPARADDTDDLVSRIINASQTQGSDPQTQAEIKKVVQDNQGLIKAIIDAYSKQLQQTQAMADDMDGPGGRQSRPEGKPQNNSAGGSSPADNNKAPVLQTSSLEPSSSLQTSHLAGYPSLPDTEPTNSVTNPTAAQLANKAAMDKQMLERKKFLKTHPDTFTP